METADFDYSLDEQQIARYPLPQRSASRLLLVSQQLQDSRFSLLPEHLSARDLLVFNNTEVLAARLYAHKRSGGRVEILIERIVDENSAYCHMRASKRPTIGSKLQLVAGGYAVVKVDDGALAYVHFELPQPLLTWLKEHGEMPLPPYLKRPAEGLDSSRYQTVYARHPGAVAAPTAGLHFDQALLTRIKAAKIPCAWVTLHIGAGTFQPLRAAHIEQHKMHQEWFSVPAQTLSDITATRAAGGAVVAVGTTVVRALETAMRKQEQGDVSGFTELFLRPGMPFLAVDRLITNFHLPRSTLLVLVCALAGYQRTMAAYRHAVASGYRFFSYGDSMLIDCLHRD